MQLIEVAGTFLQPSLVGAIDALPGDATKSLVYAGGPPLVVNASPATVAAAVNTAIATPSA